MCSQGYAFYGKNYICNVTENIYTKQSKACQMKTPLVSLDKQNKNKCLINSKSFLVIFPFA